MRALSLKQPWAYLVCMGIKDIENRTRNTKYRGPVYIHASKSFDLGAYHRLRLWGIELPEPQAYIRGAIIGEVNITGSVDDHPSRWFWGPYGYTLVAAELYQQPIPCRGMLGFFRPSWDIFRHYAPDELRPDGYPTVWGIITRELKEEHGQCCERCGRAHEPAAGYTLTVHHLDGNPANCERWNLCCLCQRCHLSIQNRLPLRRLRQFYMFEHKEWFRPHVEGFYKAQGLGGVPRWQVIE